MMVWFAGHGKRSGKSIIERLGRELETAPKPCQELFYGQCPQQLRGT